MITFSKVFRVIILPKYKIILTIIALEIQHRQFSKNLIPLSKQIQQVLATAWQILALLKFYCMPNLNLVLQIVK